MTEECKHARIRPKMRVGEPHVILSRLNGYAITSLGNDNKSQITLKELDPKDQLQQWTYQKDGTIALSWKPKKVIDISGANKARGTGLLLWDNNGGANQKWEFTRSMGIQSKLNNLLVDISGEDIKENSKLIMYDENDQRNQMWLFVPVTNINDDFLRSNNNRYKLVRQMNTNDFSIDIEIAVESSGSRIGEFETYIEGGSIARSVLDNGNHLLVVIGEEKKLDVYGMISVQIHEKGDVEEIFSIAFCIKKTSKLTSGGRCNIFGLQWLTEVDAADYKLCDYLLNDKNCLDVYESKTNQTFISSNTYNVYGTMTKGNKALIQIGVSRK